jgi:hypothetical protein
MLMPAPSIPDATTPSVDPDALVVRSRREPLADPASILVADRPQNCNACHAIFRPEPGAPPSPRARAGGDLDYHRDVILSHGMNDRCANCHSASDTERLALRDGTLIPFAETPLLCAQCHGTAYRDWQRGMHGRTMGSWITGSPEQRRLGCNECHDPHSPRYEPYVPLPGPNTLRMGETPHHDGSHAVERNPLRRRPAAQEAHP